jgi:transcriptional regulator with GAF, ATPase, and Fis domain
MSSAAIWRGEGLASALSSAQAGQGSILLREATFENRLEALRDVALTLLDAVDSLRNSQPSRDHSLRLQDEVQRFETDLIRTALERTGGNQARAARLLGVKHTTLNAKIKRYKIRCDGQANEATKDMGANRVVGNGEIAA